MSAALMKMDSQKSTLQLSDDDSALALTLQHSLSDSLLHAS
jgi:hypothetical protein